MIIEPNVYTEIPVEKESILNSGLHSHCFVKLDCNYTPISSDERQKYLSLMCFKNMDEVKRFYKDI